MARKIVKDDQITEKRWRQRRCFHDQPSLQAPYIFAPR